MEGTNPGHKRPSDRLIDPVHGLGNLVHTEGCCYFGYCRCIKVEEVKDAIRRMSKGKVSGPDDIPVEFRKSIGKEICSNYKERLGFGIVRGVENDFQMKMSKAGGIFDFMVSLSVPTFLTQSKAQNSVPLFYMLLNIVPHLTKLEVWGSCKMKGEKNKYCSSSIEEP